MSTVVDFRTAETRSAAARTLADALRDGELAVLPTETGYLLAADAGHPEASSRLIELLGEHRPPTLAVHDGREVVEELAAPPTARRLARRCWPGPVTLRIAVPDDRAPIGGVAPEAWRGLIAGGGLTLRVPGDVTFEEIAMLLETPLLVEPDPTAPVGTAAAAAERYRDHAPLVADAGPARFDQPDTAIGCTDDGWAILVPGIVGKATIARFDCELIVFVCTGNTCRSPMAEAMFRKLLAERLQCRGDELIDRGFLLASAGVAAEEGVPASVESVEVLKRLGIDLEASSSQSFGRDLADQADRVLAMTSGHLESIVQYWPQVADRVALLASDGSDVADPVGGTMDDYEVCREMIERHLRLLLDKIAPEPTPSP